MTRICLHLQALGASNWNLPKVFFTLHEQRKYTNHKICLSRNNIQKRFSSQKTTEKHPIPVNRHFSARNIQLMVSSQKTFSRKIFCWQLQKEQSWKCSQTTTNLLRDHRVLHINCFARKSVSFVSNSKT